ncbi:MAG: O-antigen ligase family protein [Candidatus Omnitrophota bacterium]
MRQGFFLLFVLFFAVRPFIDGLTYPLTQYLFQLVIIAGALIYSTAILSGKVRYRPTGLELPGFLFILVTGISTVFSCSPYRSCIVFLQYLYYFSLFFLVNQSLATEIPVKSTNPPNVGVGFIRPAGLMNQTPTTVLVAVLLTTGALISLYGIQQYLWGLKDTLNYLTEKGMVNTFPPEFLARIYSNRAFATFVYPNIFAAFLIALIPVAAFSLFPGRFKAPADRLKTVAGLLFLCLFGVTLMMTRSGGGIMTLMVVSLICLSSLWASKIVPAKKKYLPFLILIGGFILIFWGLTTLKIVPHDKVVSLTDRFFYWRSSLNITRERPLLGFGPGSFGVHYARFKLPRAMETQHSHSTFFEILPEEGLLGVITFFWFWTFLLIKTGKKKRTNIENGLFWGTLGLFLHSQFDFDLADPSLATYLFALPALITLTEGKEHPWPLSKRGREPSVKLTRIGTGIIILVLLFSGIRTIRLYRAEKIYQHGLNLFAKGENGLELLEQAGCLEPKNPTYWAQLGNIYYRAGKELGAVKIMEKAADAYRNAADAEPYAASYRFHLGSSAEEIARMSGDKRWESVANEAFKQAVLLYPTKKEYQKKAERLRGNTP